MIITSRWKYRSYSIPMDFQFRYVGVQVCSFGYYSYGRRTVQYVQLQLWMCRAAFIKIGEDIRKLSLSELLLLIL